MQENKLKQSLNLLKNIQSTNYRNHITTDHSTCVIIDDIYINIIF